MGCLDLDEEKYLNQEESAMDRSISVVLLVVGVALLIAGLQAADSLSSAFSELFSGAPSNKAIWLIVVGTIVAALGLPGLLRGKSSR